MNRLLIPLALLAVCLGSFWLSDRLGNDPELESLDVDITSPEVPLLSARRIPEFLTLPISQERLESDLDEVADDSPVLTCLAVAEADGGTVVISEGVEGLLYDHQENQQLVPASTQKLVTGAAALLALGPDYTFTTQVLSETPINENGGVGDLYLVGSGDPLLMTPDYVASFDDLDVFTDIEALADQVLAAGVTSISGGIRSISNRYDNVRYVETWPPRFAEQGQTGPLSALMINDSFTSWPATAPEREFADQLGVATTSAPGVHAAALFDDLLEARELVPARGQSEASEDLDTSDFTTIASIESPPMTTIVQQMLRFSDNTTAELLMKEMGAARGAGGATSAGARVVVDTLSQAGLEKFEFLPRDGSGLDSGNRLSCTQLIELLSEPQIRALLEPLLPVAGQHGTLANRFVGGPAEDNLRAKTGSLLNVTALAGYVDSSEGDPLAFAYILNVSADQFVSDRLRGLQTPLGETLATYPVGPPVAAIAPPGAADPNTVAIDADAESEAGEEDSEPSDDDADGSDDNED